MLTIHIDFYVQVFNKLINLYIQDLMHIQSDFANDMQYQTLHTTIYNSI